ncbi:hypothetical protein SK128_008037 [Halocaridina rubra]|uniref:Protein quiver n=1 Tax=Halocaridina rubra TaxID=373956 RepID=A0AAN8WW57_HALRR
MYEKVIANNEMDELKKRNWASSAVERTLQNVIERSKKFSNVLRRCKEFSGTVMNELDIMSSSYSSSSFWSSSRFLSLHRLFVLLLITVFVERGTCISCVQCEADMTSGQDDACLIKPPEAKACDPSMSVCMTVRTYMPAEQDSRMLVSLIRTCSPSDMGWDCEKGKNERGQIAEVCHDTCSWDGCNSGTSNNPFRYFWLSLGSMFLWIML